MDTFPSFGAEEAADHDEAEAATIEAPPLVATDERRMHVRAYNYWASLLRDRPYPSVADLDPETLEDFGPNSVLLDFTRDPEDPAVAWLGSALRHECALDDEVVERVSQVPNRSLLSRLTDHYMQIIGNQAPVGFEAEFVTDQGRDTVYRGILMPFSSGGERIDFIYGVINWKEVADPETESELRQEVGRALAEPRPRLTGAGPVWADGPSGLAAAPDAVQDEPEPESLADYLVAARASAEQAKDANVRSRASLYEALGRAYRFADAAETEPEDYAELLEDAGIKQQQRAPMTPVVKLVFGADYDKTRLTEFAAALSYGRREKVSADGFEAFLQGFEGGLKAVVAAERAARRPAAAPDRLEAAREALRHAPIQGFVTIDEDGGGEEFTLLMARRMPNGRFAVLGSVPADKTLTERAIRKVAG